MRHKDNGNSTYPPYYQSIHPSPCPHYVFEAMLIEKVEVEGVDAKLILLMISYLVFSIFVNTKIKIIF